MLLAAQNVQIVQVHIIFSSLESGISRFSSDTWSFEVGKVILISHSGCWDAHSLGLGIASKAFSVSRAKDIGVCVECVCVYVLFECRALRMLDD